MKNFLSIFFILLFILIGIGSVDDTEEKSSSETVKKNPMINDTK